MSKSQETKDILGVCEENLSTVFATVNKDAPKLFQSVIDMQQQCMQACENTMKASLSIQREYAEKVGINSNIPDAALSAIRDTNEQITKAYTLQNKSVQTAIDTTKQNIKTFNDNAKSFADLNRNIMQSWINTFAPKN